MADQNAETGDGDGNRLIATTSDAVSSLAEIAVAVAAREVLITETTAQVTGLNAYLTTLKTIHEGDQARIGSIRARARDRALQALQGPATLADVLPLLAIGSDRGNDVSDARVGAVVAEAERLLAVEPGRTVVRVAQDGSVTAHKAASSVRLNTDNSGFVLDVTNGKGLSTQLVGSLGSLVKQLPDGTYGPGHGIYAGSAQIREGFGRIVKANPKDAIAWAAALQDLGTSPKMLGARRGDIDETRKIALDVACDLTVTDRQAATMAVKAAFCLDERRQPETAEELITRIVKELTQTLGGISTQNETTAKNQRMALRREVEHRVELILKLANRRIQRLRQIDIIFDAAESK